MLQPIYSTLYSTGGGSNKVVPSVLLYMLVVLVPLGGEVPDNSDGTGEAYCDADIFWNRVIEKIAPVIFRSWA